MELLDHFKYFKIFGQPLVESENFSKSSLTDNAHIGLLPSFGAYQNSIIGHK